MPHKASLSDKSSQMNQLDSLAAQIHSASETESYEALNTLAQNKTNDSARALIEAYLNCQWRDTKLAIIRALGRNASERSVAFLLNLAGCQDDIGLEQEILIALGETKDTLAATFLLESLKPSPLYMKPWIVAALTRIPDFRSITELRRILVSPETIEHPLLLRNCIVALSEMKDVTILDQLIQMLRDRIQNHKKQIDETSITLLGAIAKLSRSQHDIAEFERFFSSEMLHEQVYKQCLTQLVFREQWTLEDYLGKVFFSDSFHPSLPLELNSFKTADVQEALLLFKSESKHFHSICTVLRFFVDSDDLYKNLINFDDLSNDELCKLLSHSMLHRNESTHALQAKTFEHRIKDNLSSVEIAQLFSVWLKATLCLEANPMAVLMGLLEVQLSNREWHEQNKIELINALVNCTLTFHKQKTWSKKHISLIGQLIEQESNETVLGRWLRAVGEADLSFLKFTPTTLERIKNSERLCASALLMLSRMQNHQHNALLTLLHASVNTGGQHKAAFIRACGKLKQHDKALPDDETLATALSSTDTEEIIAALTFLCRHPRPQFLQKVNQLCQPEPSQTASAIHAIVAARSFKSDTSINSLTECLGSKSKVIAGRALDTLLSIDSSAARLSVIQYLTEHQTDTFIVDKVLRSLKLPEKNDEEAATVLDLALAKMPASPLREELLQLAVHLRHGQSEQTSSTPSTDIIRQLDELLASKINGYMKLPDPIKASLRSAEIPHKQPDLFEGSVDKSASVVQYCKAIDLTLEREFGQKTLFPKLEQQLHIFQNILRKAELDQDTINTAFVMRHLGIEHLFEPQTFPSLKMKMLSRSILTGKILRERTQVIDGLKAWAVLLLIFSGHDFLWGKPLSPVARIKLQTLAQKLVSLQDLRNPAAHRQTMLTLAPLSEIRKDVFEVFSIIQSLF